MTGKLFINNEDAWNNGIVMGSGFIDAIAAACSLKDFIENTSALEHGKRVIVDAPKLASRDVTLTFNIHGDTPELFKAHRTYLFNLLYAGNVNIRVPELGNETYHLIFRKSTSYGQNNRSTFCKVACKFDEPNPSNRA